jgi:hypothetical protein
MTMEGAFKKIAFNHFNKHKIQPFHYMEENLFHVVSGFVIPKANYSMKILFDPDLRRLTDCGIIQKLFRDVTPPQDFKQGAQSQVLDLWHFTSLFLFYGILIIVSIISFIKEVSE